MLTCVLAFTDTHDSRYAPVAVVMEPDHGFGESWHYGQKSWGFFDLTPQEDVLWLFFQMAWPGAWTPMNDFGDQNRSELAYVFLFVVVVAACCD